MFGVKEASSSTSSLTQVDVETSPFITSDEKSGLDDAIRCRKSLKDTLKSYFWVSTTFILAISQIATLIQSWQLQTIGTYETGFATDLEPSKVVIDLEKRLFTGGLSLDENGKLFREQERGQPQYVGPPSPEIDNAWEGIMTASEIVLDGRDATDVVRTSIEEPEGNAWRLELDVYHSLHCVNQVRRAVDVDYYFPNNTTPSFYRAHIDHCIDYLRQVVQCQSDMTPLTFYWNEQIQAHLPNFEHAHTCRNFDKVHQWAIRHKATNRVTNAHHHD